MFEDELKELDTIHRQAVGTARFAERLMRRLKAHEVRNKEEVEILPDQELPGTSQEFSPNSSGRRVIESFG